MKQNIKIIIVIIVLLFCIFTIIFGAIKLISKNNSFENKITIEKDKIFSENEEKETVKEEKTTMSLVMCGDYLIHSSIYKDAAKNASGKGYDFKPMLKYIKEIVQNYDLAYYNQETILGGSELGVSDYPNFNSPYEAGDAMLDAGFNLVSLATNHTMDSGVKAVLNSREYWNKQEDVLAVRKL